MQDFTEGQRRTSRRTGEVQEYRAGQWVTVQPGQGSGGASGGVGVVRLPQQPDPITPYQAAQLELSRRAADRADRQFQAQEDERQREATGPRELSRDDARRVDARVSRAREAAALERDLLRFRELNEQQRTGWLTGATAGMQAGFGDAEVAEMRSIINRLAPNMRAEGSGATSDFEMRMYVSALPNLTNSSEANDAIIARSLEETRRAVAEAEFYERYASENGSLLGADTAFRDAIQRGAVRVDGRAPSTSEPGRERGDPGALDLEALARGGPPAPPGGGRAGDQGEIVINRGVFNRNGRAINTATGEDLGPFAEWESRQQAAYAHYAAGDRTRMDAEIRAAEDARERSAATPGAIRAFNQGVTGEFMDELDAIGAGLETRAFNAVRRFRGEEIPYTADQAADAVRNAEREAGEEFRAAHPAADLGLRIAGGVVMPGAGRAGAFVRGGRTAGQMGARAGAMGALYGGVTGLGAGEGDILDRAPGGALNALAGYGIGRVAQGGINALASRAAARSPSTQPSRNAFLMERGVRLSPGQAARDIPGIGAIVNATEEGLGSLPVVGGLVRRQRDLGVRDFNTSLYADALGQIDAAPTPGVAPGFSGLADVSQQLGQRYDEVLDGISGRTDDVFRGAIDEVLAEAATATPGVRDQVTAAIQHRILRPLERAGGVFDGQTIKTVESQLTSIVNNAVRSSQLDGPEVARLVDNARAALRDMIGRAAPERAPELQALNQGYARYARLREAGTMAGPMGQDGVISPTNLATVVRRRSTPEQLINRNALLQDFADAGQNLRNVMSNSGTADRIGLGATGLAGVSAVMGSPEAATAGIGLAGAVAAAYSPPVQFILNRIYRAGQNPQSVNQGVSELLAMARQNPALSQEVTRALRDVGSQLTDGPRQADGQTGGRLRPQPSM